MTRSNSNFRISDIRYKFKYLPRERERKKNTPSFPALPKPVESPYNNPAELHKARETLRGRPRKGAGREVHGYPFSARSKLTGSPMQVLLLAVGRGSIYYSQMPLTIETGQSRSSEV